MPGNGKMTREIMTASDLITLQSECVMSGFKVWLCHGFEYFISCFKSKVFKSSAKAGECPIY